MTITEQERTELLTTLAPRCLGCAERMPDAVWTPHGTCRPYYGAGMRVDYEAWCALIERVHDEPLFDRWAEGSPMLGVPSYSLAADSVGHVTL